MVLLPLVSKDDDVGTCRLGKVGVAEVTIKHNPIWPPAIRDREKWHMAGSFISLQLIPSPFY